MRTKILLTGIILFCIHFTSNAQMNKGEYLLGAGFNYNNSKDQSVPNSNEAKYFAANVQLGKFINNNAAAGIIISYNNSNTHVAGYPDSNYNKGNGFSAGVFYRKYKKLLKDLYFFGEFDGLYSHSKNDQATSNYYYMSHTISNGGTVSFIPGISYAMCKRFSMELLMPNLLAVSYTHSKVTSTIGNPPVSTSGKQNAFSVAANFSSNFLSSFGIGFKFLLGK